MRLFLTCPTKPVIRRSILRATATPTFPFPSVFLSSIFFPFTQSLSNQKPSTKTLRSRHFSNFPFPAMRASTGVKVVVLGDHWVGKTSFLQQFHTHTFDPDVETTVAVAYFVTEITTERGSIQLSIWDTAGSEKYRSLMPTYLRDATAAIILFDISNRESFDNLQIWLGIVREHCGECCRVYIVGNKNDLAPGFPITEAEDWAMKREYPFFQASAKRLPSVNAVFRAVAGDLSMRRQPLDQVGTFGEGSKKCC
jgi:small GTP-binding protein